MAHEYHDLKVHIKSECPVCNERYSNLDIRLSEIAIDDISTAEDHYVLLSSLIKEVYQESQPNIDIHLGLTDSHKGMYVVFTFVSMLFPIAGLYDSIPRDSQITKQAWLNAQEWGNKSDDEKKAFWESESNTWGLDCSNLSQPPPTLGWHFNVRKDFRLVRLPFVGLSPFLDAFGRQFKQPSKLYPKQIVKDWSKKGIEVFRKNKDIIDAIRGLGIIFETPVEEVAAPILLRLERNDRGFWHDCIKHGANMTSCKIRTLKEKWELQKGIFVVNRLGDPIFKEFDAIFTENIKSKEAKSRFKELYLQLNAKICSALRDRSQPIKEWLDEIAEMVQKEEGTQDHIRIFEDDNSIKSLTICAGPELDIVIKELLRNAMQHSKGDVIVRITERGIIIKNKGEFSSTKWRKSSRSRHTKIVCEDYHLRFQIIGDLNTKEVNTSIFWGQKPKHILPVNAKTIMEGGNY
jgi:hypothetical protein